MQVWWTSDAKWVDVRSSLMAAKCWFNGCKGLTFGAILSLWVLYMLFAHGYVSANWWIVFVLTLAIYSFAVSEWVCVCVCECVCVWVWVCVCVCVTASYNFDMFVKLCLQWFINVLRCVRLRWILNWLLGRLVLWIHASRWLRRHIGNRRHPASVGKAVGFFFTVSLGRGKQGTLCAWDSHRLFPFDFSCWKNVDSRLASFWGTVISCEILPTVTYWCTMQDELMLKVLAAPGTFIPFNSFLCV